VFSKQLRLSFEKERKGYRPLGYYMFSAKGHMLSGPYAWDRPGSIAIHPEKDRIRLLRKLDETFLEIQQAVRKLGLHIDF